MKQNGPRSVPRGWENWQREMTCLALAIRAHSGKERPISLELWNKGKFTEEVGYIGDSKAKQPRSQQKDNQEICHSRKIQPLLGWRDGEE